MLVVDASVAVKWFYPEADSDKAESLLFSGKKLIAPEIIRIEVAAALTRLFRMQSVDLATATALLDDWGSSLVAETVSLEPTTLDFNEAVKASLSAGHQLQDCLYVSAAARYDVPLITADIKLLDKKEKLNCDIQTLTDFKLY